MGWGYANIGGGGSGGGLNLTINTGSLDRRPSSGRQNDIFIVSDIPVKFYIMAAEEPHGVSQNTYWFSISTAGENLLNLLKKNQLLLALNEVSVFNGTEWHGLDAYLWNNGAWIQFSSTFVWDGVALNGSEQYEKITGGWYAKPDVVKSYAGGIFFANNATGSVTHRNILPFKKYTTLHFTAHVTVNRSAGLRLMVDGKNVASRTLGQYTNITPPSGYPEYEIDISKVDGKGFIELFFEKYVKKYEPYSVKKIWLT